VAKVLKSKSGGLADGVEESWEQYKKGKIVFHENLMKRYNCAKQTQIGHGRAA